MEWCGKEYMKKSTIGWIITGVCAIAWMLFNGKRADSIISLTPTVARLQEIQQEAKRLDAEANTVMQVYHAQKAEAEDKNSWSSLIGIGVRSFFDGFTLGAFTDEGVFTESKKIERWANDFAQRNAVCVEKARQIQAAYASLVEEDKTLRQAVAREYSKYKSANSARSWSLLVGIAAVVFAIINMLQERRTVTNRVENDANVIECHKCGQKMRVPKLDRNLRITCPSCKNQFLLHS
jgi:hypothetical protein